MRRFYCTVCNRIKRTQNWPSRISNPTATNPVDRIGECDYHTEHTRHSLAKLTNESLEQIESRFNRSSQLKKVVNK